MAKRQDKRPRANLSGSVGKTPRSIESPTGGKHPHEAPFDRNEVMRRMIVWRFQDMDKTGQWSILALDSQTLETVLNKLGDFEKSTIRELFYTGDEPGKHYDVENLPRISRDRLVELGREDETRVARLRLSGTKRLYGFLRENVFYMLWWDPLHQVYPSSVKHT